MAIGRCFEESFQKALRSLETGLSGWGLDRVDEDVSPIELERLNMFPDNHTKLDGITDTKRAFFMGNALVVGVISRLAFQLNRQISQEG